MRHYILRHGIHKKQLIGLATNGMVLEGKSQEKYIEVSVSLFVDLPMASMAAYFHLFENAEAAPIQDENA